VHDEETILNTQPILFIQGAGMMHDPEGSGRLAAYLARELSADHRVIAPEMPDADNPHYQRWRDRIEQELQAIDEEVILIGHSLGGSVLLKYLAEGSYRKPVPGLFLVSVPNWGPDGWRTTNSPYRMTLARDCSRRGSSCTTVAMTQRCRSRTWPTTRSTYRSRRRARSKDRSTRLLKGFRCCSRTSRACLAEDQLACGERRATNSCRRL
jgi:pimeloyl-ACP methyl ester carboxylesterase